MAVGIFVRVRDEMGYFRFLGYINIRRPGILIHIEFDIIINNIICWKIHVTQDQPISTF